ncbi:MAG TPA: DUF6338 family protein [Pirellulales bacterium]
MPTTLQGLLIVFFVLPGFLAVEVDARRRPAREHSAFDKTVLSVLYSAFVHLPLLFCWSFAAVRWLGADFNILTEEWITQQIRARPLHLQGYIMAYFASSMATGWLLGSCLAGVTRHIAPVWARETYLRVLPKGWTDRVMERLRRPAFVAAISVLVKMKSGDQYAGILRTAPGDYDELQQKDKYFSIIQAVYLPKDGSLEKLGGDQVVLLNMADVEALLVAVEPLLQ